MPKRILDVAGVLAEADIQQRSEVKSRAASPTKVASVSESSFKKNWDRTIRPVMISAMSVVKIFKPKYAEYIAQSIAFIDLQLQPEEEVE